MVFIIFVFFFYQLSVPPLSYRRNITKLVLKDLGLNLVRFQVLNRNECEDGCLHRFKSASLLATNCNTEFSTASFPELVDAVVNMKTPGISRMSADQPITTKFHL